MLGLLAFYDLTKRREHDSAQHNEKGRINVYTLSGRIGKEVPRMMKVRGRFPEEVAPIYAEQETLRKYCPSGWGE